MKWSSSASRSWILSQWWYWISWSDRCSVLCFLERTVTLQLISGPVHNIIHKLSGGCVLSARLYTVPTYHCWGLVWSDCFVYLGIQEPIWVFTFRQLRGSLCQLHLHLILIFLLQFQFYLSSDGENLRIYLGLLRYKEHLDLHLQVFAEILLARFSLSATMYGANRLCLRNFAVYLSTIQSSYCNLIIYSFISFWAIIEKNLLIEILRELVPSDRLFQSHFF